MTDFRNNLEKGDRVQHADSGRVGTVEFTPLESSPKAAIKWQGTVSFQYTPIGKLRLIVDGLAEKVPPCDGEPPGADAPRGRAPAEAKPAKEMTPLEHIRAERVKVKAEMTELERQFKQMRAADDRLAEAEKVLTA